MGEFIKLVVVLIAIVFKIRKLISELWGGAVSYKYRVEDPRFIDPLAASFPWNSLYAFIENHLIDGRKMEGLEVVFNKAGQ